MSISISTNDLVRISSVDVDKIADAADIAENQSTTASAYIKDDSLNIQTVNMAQYLRNSVSIKEAGDIAKKVIGSGSQTIDETVKIISGDGGNEVFAAITGSAENSSNADIYSFNSAANSPEGVTGGIKKVLGVVTKFVGENNILGTILRGAATVLNDAIVDYQDGVTETSFGSNAEESWAGKSTSFLNTFKSGNGNYRVAVLNSTPLDSGNMSKLYGTTMLGCPFLFGNNADPANRTLINSFIKDGRFLSLTPGLPKYNGGEFTQSASNSILNQTKNGESMLLYLLKNGIDADFARKDKRYYTFRESFAEYYAYLEAMLNPIWIKMGLAEADSERGRQFNIFSFFNIGGEANSGSETLINPTDFKNLKAGYKSLSFFLNPTGSVSESINSSPTSIGVNQANAANQASEQYQTLNYLTGMGTNGTTGRVRRTAGIATNAISQVGSFASEAFGNFLGKDKKGLERVAGLIKDIANINANTDVSGMVQAFAVTNGMRITYPELWSDSSYSKSINFSLNFTSPYGDPLSIFKYVYVPFCALLCFALPRQAASNGYVSPFFVRADIPGLISSDLAFISDMTWTRGGENNLWTKDGLPRSISVALTITDLYPYLAMSKRFSYLSANPSYTVFLDSMAGMHAVNNDLRDDPLNEYWHRMVERISGTLEGETSLWNKFNPIKKKVNTVYGNTERSSSVSGKISEFAIPWLTSTS